jgi:hypothetical protein
MPHIFRDLVNILIAHTVKIIRIFTFMAEDSNQTSDLIKVQQKRQELP